MFAELLEWQRERITRPGRIGRWVGRDIRSGDRNHLERLIRRGLPNRDTTAALLRAAHELLELRRDLGAARSAGVEVELCRVAIPDLDETVSILSRVADRLAVVAAQQLEYPHLERALFNEAVRLEQLADALHDLRRVVAEMAVGETEGELLVTRANVVRSLSHLFRDVTA